MPIHRSTAGSEVEEVLEDGDPLEENLGNADAKRALLRIRQKLDGLEGGMFSHDTSRSLSPLLLPASSAPILN